MPEAICAEQSANNMRWVGPQRDFGRLNIYLQFLLIVPKTQELADLEGLQRVQVHAMMDLITPDANVQVNTTLPISCENDGAFCTPVMLHLDYDVSPGCPVSEQAEVG